MCQISIILLYTADCFLSDFMKKHYYVDGYFPVTM